MKTIYADKLINEIVFHTNFPTDIKEEIEDIIQNAPPVEPEIISRMRTIDGTISMKEIVYDAIEHFRNTIESINTEEKYNEGFVDGLEFCISHLSSMLNTGNQNE